MNNRFIRLLPYLCLSVLWVIPVALWSQDEAGETVETLPRKTTRRITYKDFYDLQMNMETLKRQMDQLRLDVEAYKSREMTPDVYRNILKRLTPPKLTHELLLTNGTIVRGNIIEENIDELTIETTLGNLTLDKSMIRSIQDIADIRPKVEFMGDAKEEIYDDHRIYTGTVKNLGISRGDYVRVIFRLWNAKTELVAEDSAFVEGTTMAYLAGVVTDTAVEPDQSVNYRVRVDVPEEDPVSYITREIHWERID